MNRTQWERRMGWRLPRYLRRKTARIEARQVARAVVIVNRAPTLIHNGKAAR